MLSILVDYNILLRLAYFFNLWKNEEKHQHKVGRMLSMLKNGLYSQRLFINEDECFQHLHLPLLILPQSFQNV